MGGQRAALLTALCGRWLRWGSVACLQSFVGLAPDTLADLPWSHAVVDHRLCAHPPPPQIHWFSIVNSCVTVLLLTGFLATILMRVRSWLQRLWWMRGWCWETQQLCRASNGCS